MVRFFVLFLLFGSALPQDPVAPQISINDVTIPDQSERTISSGSALSVRCLGDGNVQLRSSSFKLMHDVLDKNFTATRAHPRHTGTYTCTVLANQSTALTSVSAHLYVSDPQAAFVLPRSPSNAVAGEDFLLRCLPTNPNLQHLSIQKGDGSSLPSGMNFTFDPWRGALIHKVQRSFQGSYHCTGRRQGREEVSEAIFLWVEEKLVDPPSLFVSHEAVIRLVGEKFQVTCLCSNRNHDFSVNWTHPRGQVFLGSSNDISSKLDYQDAFYVNNLTLTVDPVQTSDSGPFICFAWNEAGVSTATTYIDVREQAFIKVSLLHQNATSLITNTSSGPVNATWAGVKVPVGGVTHVKVSKGQDLSLKLLFEGYPPIGSLHWEIPDHMTNSSISTVERRPQEHRVELQLLFGRVHHEDSGIYSVLFSNDFFNGNVSIQLQVNHEVPPLHHYLIGSCSVGGVLLLLLVLVLWRWRQAPRYQIRWKIIESCNGNNYTFIDPSQLPYDQHWEFPRDRLKLGAVLGSGAFGKVVAARVVGLEPNQNETTVAVKMLKPRALPEEREALMSELKILSYIGFHQNIVNLLGACTTGGPMLMITEYCHHGDLLNFLRTRVHRFLSEEETPYKNTRLRSDSGISCGSEDHEMKALRPGPRGTCLDNVSGVDSMSLSDLMRFSLEVAQGLDFLSSKNCIHRDVAARNVLLSEHRIAKICDFGLARDIRNDDSYIVKGNARLPVKWMSPESIFLCVYTVQSDVWSYGVLLWEIFSLGELPYPQVPVNQFCSDLKKGKRLNKPDLAPDEIFSLMSSCWEKSAACRPSFPSLLESVGNLLPPAFHQRYSLLTEQFQSESSVSPARTGLEPDQDSAAPQVTVHQSGEELQSQGPAHIHDITAPSEITMETRGDTALDAEDKDKLKSEEKEVTSSAQEESSI